MFAALSVFVPLVLATPLLAGDSSVAFDAADSATNSTYAAPEATGGSSRAIPFSIVGEELTYKVVPGDILYDISRREGLAFPAVARANGIEDPNLIWAGTSLVLPTRMILPGVAENGVVVNIPEYRLFVFNGGALYAVYPVTVGLPTWRTPLGSFTVTTKVENPTWYMPPNLAEREKVKREIIPPGPHNPLGDFWIGTSLRHTGIHSTNSPMTIGRALSHGCLRLYPEHIRLLAKKMKVGDSGEILYLPAKAAVNGDSIFVEVHPDIYGLVPDFRGALRERLQQMGVWERVDVALVDQAVREARGIPVMVQRVKNRAP